MDPLLFDWIWTDVDTKEVPVFVKSVPLRIEDKDAPSAPILNPTETESAPTEIPEDASTPLPLDHTETVDEEPAPTKILEDDPITLSTSSN